MKHDDIIEDLERRIHIGAHRDGGFASTHEALGVALKEWDELRAAVHGNILADVEHECLDLAAVLVRLARCIRKSQASLMRGVRV